MIEYDVTFHGFEEQLEKLAKFDHFHQKRFETAMDQSVIVVESAVRPLVPVGVSGRLKNSIGSEVQVESIGSIVGRVGSSLKNEEYPAVMEHGRRPGTMPPPDKLVRWVHVKRLSGTYSIKSHRRQGGKARQEAEDWEVAFMIARAIKARGITGKHYMRDGFQKSMNQVIRFFEQAAKLLTQDIANNGS